MRQSQREAQGLNYIWSLNLHLKQADVLKPSTASVIQCNEWYNDVACEGELIGNSKHD